MSLSYKTNIEGYCKVTSIALKDKLINVQLLLTL